MTASRWRKWLDRSQTSLSVGLLITLVAATAHFLGFTRPLELLIYDFYVREFSRITPSQRIVHIDIDDDSLKRVSSWPWPRDLQAELIRVLHDLGARQIVIDLLYSEPNAGQVRLPSLDAYASIEGEVEQIGEMSAENVVFPDDELAEAIRAAGNVFISFYYETGQNSDGGGSADAGLADRLAKLLRTDFDLNRDELAGRLDSKPSRVEAVLAGVKRRVAQERVRAILERRPEANVREVFSQISTRSFDHETADRADVIFAYLQEISARELWKKCPPVPPALKGRLMVAREVVPPLYKFTQGTRGQGFVAFEPDGDGRTRRIPLMIEWKGVLIEQLGFSAVRQALGIRLEDITLAANGDMLIAAAADRPAMRVPLDESGEMLINWSVPGRDWSQCFEHIPVTRLLGIYDCHRRIRENEIRRQIRLGELVHLISGPDGFALYREQVNKLLDLKRQLRRARLTPAGMAAPALAAIEQEAARLQNLVDATHNDTIAQVRELWKDLSAETRPADAELAAEYDRFHKAIQLIEGPIAACERANQDIAAVERELAGRLRASINGRICCVGYTATAVADMVNTPPYARVPGVLVHSSVLNGFLQHQFRDWSSRWVEAIAILLLGGLTSVLTVTRGPRESLVLVAILLILLLLVNGMFVFERMDHWLRLVTAMLALLAAWAAIVVMRFLTVERERRRFSRAVAQYVSPAMARQIADSAADFDLAPVSGQVTCFFSDLAGFTRLSEQLGPEGTRTVLNPYLEAMSSVLHRHNALINKFIGDGIFAFFNPPILPCEGHERAACAAAIESQKALSELKARNAHHLRARDFERLAMRIGIGAGPVFVGDYGSENKLDYTCMGDTVNLASRLEGANKVFGTTIMVNGAAHDAVGGDFAFRPLGALQVKGQTVAVRVYELLGYAGELAGELGEFRDRFAAAVAAFGRRDWDDALSEIEACARLRPQDPGVAFYRAAIQRYRHSPPGDDWNGGVELTEK